MAARSSGLWVALAVLGVVSCSDPTEPVRSLAPDGYRARYVEVRGCRSTLDHLSAASTGAAASNIRVLIDPDAAAAYRANAAVLAAGTTVIKEEFTDPGCTQLSALTIMQKQAAGYDPAHGDWRWQRVRVSDQAVLEDGVVARCWRCHDTAACRARDWQCTEP
ncbi:MAG: hypothetical protein JNK72_12115 [Myxococcales bacterium]|nr:hypothetical protein [Myxococcales bacterium]